MAAVESPTLTLVHTFHFTNTPESVAFSPSGDSSTSWTLIVGLRDESSLRYIDCQTLEARLVSLNERDWDTHASFTPLQLKPSPDGKYLLVATDKSQHIIYKLGTNQRLRVLSEHTCGDYGRPCVAWDASGKYVYSNTDYEHDVYVYDVVTQRMVQKLRGHHGSVRGLEIFGAGADRTLISGGFDKSLKVWHRPRDRKKE